MEDKEKKGLEGTGLCLPVNHHGNLKSASSDQDFKDVLLQIKSSKTTVSFPIIPHQILLPLSLVLRFSWVLDCLIFVIQLLFRQLSIMEHLGKSKPSLED